MIVASLTTIKEPLLDMDLAKYYGSLSDTYFTLVTAMTGGAEWTRLLVPLEAFSFWYSCAFPLLIGFMKIGALNIVAAIVFVYVLRHRDSLLQRVAFMNQERDQETLAELRCLFKASGKEHHGRITEKTCRQVLEGQGMKHLKTLGLTVEKAIGLFRMMDKDAEKRKDVEGFIFLLSHAKGDSTLMLSAMMRWETNRIVHHIDKALTLVETRADTI